MSARTNTSCPSPTSEPALALIALLVCLGIGMLRLNLAHAELPTRARDGAERQSSVVSWYGPRSDAAGDLGASDPGSELTAGSPASGETLTISPLGSPSPLSRSVGAQHLDGLAAVLGGANATEPARTILQSDVELRARLSLLSRNSERALFGELPRSLLRATLSELIGEQLIAIEAERVQIAAPAPVEVMRELEELEREAGGRTDIVRLLAWSDASQLELEAIASRRALISAFLRANLEGVSVVTEAEVDARLQTDAPRFAVESSESPEMARSAVRAALAKDALARHIEHWVRTLRARTRVRVFALYDNP